jgi:hypothetical protein
MLSLAILALPCSPLLATGVVTQTRVTLDDGNVTALLEKTSQYHVDAMRTLIDARYRDNYRAIRWESLETAMRDAPLARLEYHYTMNGTAQVKVYHAMGGRPLGSIAKSIFEGPTRPGTPDTPVSPGWPDPEIDGDEALTIDASDLVDDAAVDVEDSAFFVEFNETNVRARILPTEGSALSAFADDERNRAFDPEFKAMRTIEHDLVTETLPRGGSVRGFVSTPTCSSCKYAMQRLADTYGLDLHVTNVVDRLTSSARQQLIDAGTARVKGTLLVDATSGRPLMAADLLHGARAAQIRQTLSPRAMGRTFKGMSWTRRSFHLGVPVVPRLSRVSEGSNSPGNSSREGSPSINNDAAETSNPGC